MVADETKLPALTKDSIRAAIFATKKPNTRKVMFFGQEIELRQPNLGEVMANAGSESEVSQAVIYRALINHAYLPGTDVKLFDDTDLDSFKAMPFGADFTRVAQAYSELTELNFRGAVES